MIGERRQVKPSEIKSIKIFCLYSTARHDTCHVYYTIKVLRS